MLSIIDKFIHLKSVAMFSEIPDNTLANIAVILEAVEFSPDEPIFHKGDPGDAMYIILSGRVQVHDGPEIDILGEKVVFGEMALLDGKPRSASVTALEDTVLLRLPQENFQELLEDHIEIAQALIHMLAQRLRARTEDLTELRVLTI